MIKPALEVPPQAQKPLSLCAISARSVVFSSKPSITVVGRPNFRVSRRMRIRCCSFSISPQTQRSLGSPQVVQTSAMTFSPTHWSSAYIRLSRGLGNCQRAKFLLVSPNFRLSSIRDCFAWFISEGLPAKLKNRCRRYFRWLAIPCGCTVSSDRARGRCIE